jgi:hypothetical protein
MDDLAPAPAQRTCDDGERRPVEIFPARKKSPKKVQPAPTEKQSPEPQPASDHELDVLG